MVLTQLAVRGSFVYVITLAMVYGSACIKMLQLLRILLVNFVSTTF